MQQGGASFNYEDPLIPKLLKECKRLGEGGNSLEEDSVGGGEGVVQFLYFMYVSSNLFMF